jgi:hypothetical protein
MDIFDALQKIRGSLKGSLTSSSDAQMLVDRLPDGLVPAWLVKAMCDYPLAGTSFELTEGNDESGLGADLQWFSPKMMLEEALQFYPGISVLPLGYLPVAGCLLGSGDPYFLRVRDAKISDAVLVRVPHDFAIGDPYPEELIEVVASSLSKFLQLAAVEAPTGSH